MEYENNYKLHFDKKELLKQTNVLYRAFYNDKRRYNIFYGGAGSGKSTFIAQRLLYRTLTLEGHNGLVIRKYACTHKYSTYALLCQLINKWKLFSLFSFKRASSHLMIQCRNGNEIVFLGLGGSGTATYSESNVGLDSDVEKIKSITFASGIVRAIWVEEASEISESAFEQLNLRLRGSLVDNFHGAKSIVVKRYATNTNNNSKSTLPKRKQKVKQPNLEQHLRWDLYEQEVDFFQITLSFNPIAEEHWIKKLFFEQIDWLLTETEKANPNFSPLSKSNTSNKAATSESERYQWFSDKLLVMQSTYNDNHWLDKNYGVELKALKHKNMHAYNIYALGKWSTSEKKVFSNYQVWSFTLTEADMDEVTYGMDFGFNHPFVVIQLGMKDGELYALKEWWERGFTNLELIRKNADKSFLPNTSLCIADSAEPKSILDWNIAGYKVKAAFKGVDSVRHGYNFLKSHRFHIQGQFCPNLAREIVSLSYRTDANGALLDEYQHAGDDSLAACRYATEHWWHRRNRSTTNKDNLSSFHALTQKIWHGI